MTLTPQEIDGWYEFSHDKLGYKRGKQEWVKERERGQIDLFWLAKHCLGLDLVDSYVCRRHPVEMGPEPAPCRFCESIYAPCPGLTSGISAHRQICDAFVHKNPNETIFNQDTKKTRAIFAPRGSFKSSIDRADCAQWVICFPDVRIVCFSASPDLAAAFVGSIKLWFTLKVKDVEKDHFECNPECELFQQLYPEHLISPVRKEADGEFTTPFRLKKSIVEPTIFPLKLEGSNSGWHAEVGKFDDCVSDGNSGPKSTAEERAKVGENIRLKRKVILASGFRDYIGTPYADDDAYAQLLERGRPQVVLQLPAWEVKEESKRKHATELTSVDYNLLLPIDGKGAPLLTYDFLEAEQAEDEFLFNCQYLVTPKRVKDAIFTDQMILSHTITAEGLPQAGTYKIFSAWDLASSTGKESDYSVGCVGFFAIAGPLVGRMFIVEVIRGKFSKVELPYKIAFQAAKWRVERIGIEKSPGADFLEGDIARQLVICGYPECPLPEWFPVDTQKNAKEVRAENTSLLFSTDRLYFLNEIPSETMESIRKEFVRFKPHSNRKDDIVDAVAHLARYLPKNIELPKNEVERQARAEQWAKEKHLHDMIYDPQMFLPPPPESVPQKITEWEGQPVFDNIEQQMYGS